MANETKNLETKVEFSYATPKERAYILEVSEEKVRRAKEEDPSYDTKHWKLNYHIILEALKTAGACAVDLGDTHEKIPVPQKIYVTSERNIWGIPYIMREVRDSPYVIKYPTQKCKKLGKV